MKTSGWLFGAAAVAVLVLQGCAGSGGVKYAAGAQPGAASQASASSMPVVTAINSKDDFDAVKAAVDKLMQPGGRYASVDPAGRATVNGRFQDMSALFAQYGTIDKMAPAAKERVDSDQNAINAVLAAHDGNRLVCHNEMPVGSHLPKRVCRTLTEIQNEQKNSQQLIRRMNSIGSYNQVGAPHH
jgi:hypothetical protein